MSYIKQSANFVNYMKKNKIFTFTVFIPTFMAILYYGIFASDIYISESKIVIRNSEQKVVSGLDSVLQSTGFGGSNNDAYIVKDYILSRDALMKLNKDMHFKDIYQDDSISIFDRFDGFGINDSFEALHEYYQKYTEDTIDPQSFILTISVRSFNPDNAKNINEYLIKISEDLVNKLNERMIKDTVGLAEKEAKKSLDKFKEISSKLSKYRDTKSIFDPTQQSIIQLQLISKLQDELIATKTQLSQIKTIAPESPQIVLMQTKIKNLESDIAKETSKIVGGGKDSFSGKMSEYDKLVLEKEFAAKQLAMSLAALEQAKNEAIKKQLYLEKVAMPNLPDYPLEPYRIKNIFIIFVLGLISWGILSMIIVGIKEHND